MPDVPRLDGLANQIQILHEHCGRLAAENHQLRTDLEATRKDCDTHHAAWRIAWEQRMQAEPNDR